MTRRVPLSLIDFCTIYQDESPGESMQRSVELARKAEGLGFSRIWYAEHHNMRHIASSVPAVLIAHVAAHTEKIRLGAGGVMLPNHAPYTVAEQFGTLAELHPGRIDLGLGRAPGTDMNTLGRALRRSPDAAEHFPDDIVELRGYLSGHSRIPGVRAVPGEGTNVPLYVLGSSMYGASLAAQLGIPYAFASHFAPTRLKQATTHYRENFTPSEILSEPYVVAAVNVVADESEEAAAKQREKVERERVRKMITRSGSSVTEEQLDSLVASPQGRQMIDMLRYTATGTGEQVADYLEEFSETAKADELMISLQGPTYDHTLKAMDILAEAWGLDPNDTAGAPGDWARNL
ncbi:alkane 1-monooxygenase [Corynebacterium yudongzhengii]|uniref:LLM class flavin-dependent oxidoreductase n=1 Tax=Corynebacterium yudongzhengii TaxID=2080740 RepID=A0A2U1T4F8_9CORY|nr:LLM class flavin-dependent oxidoreductase [Corynebacterium yudongzhengii]AWB82424.1 alkane 1-monooxygenase [Corynebacterium yudongzhengii]PWC00890.1 LLM class flavin-dependent oxidoreductase [Corynebacterium yudongzhengii]